MKNLIDEGLKDCRGVSKSIAHDQVLIAPPSGEEGSLPFIPYTNSDHVLSTSEIKSCVDLWFM